MKKRISTLNVLLAIIAISIAPLYQSIQQRMTNIPGDGKEIFGDNLLKPVLGVKTNYYIPAIGTGTWDPAGQTIEPAPWMRSLFGFDEHVVMSNGYLDDRTSSGIQIVGIWLLRFLTKILIAIAAIVVTILAYGWVEAMHHGLQEKSQEKNNSVII